LNRAKLRPGLFNLPGGQKQSGEINFFGIGIRRAIGRVIRQRGKQVAGAIRVERRRERLPVRRSGWAERGRGSCRRREPANAATEQHGSGRGSRHRTELEEPSSIEQAGGFHEKRC